MDMDRFQVPEEMRHTVPVVSANGLVSQVEQLPQSLESPRPRDNGSVDPELDMIGFGLI